MPAPTGTKSDFDNMLNEYIPKKKKKKKEGGFSPWTKMNKEKPSGHGK